MCSRSGRIGSLAAALSLLLATSALAAPNIILVVLDDVTACWVGKYSTDRAECSEAYATPRIDTLAAGGVTVKTAWAMPTCTPWRGAVMTGTYPTENRGGRLILSEVLDTHPGLSAARPNLARALEAGGYNTYAYGKWHLAGNALGAGQTIHPSSMGFTAGRGSIGNLTNTTDPAEGGVGYEEWQLVDFMAGTTAEETTYATTFTIDDATAVLNNAEPWFLYLPLNAPHDPFHQPPVEVPPLYDETTSCDSGVGGADLDEICYDRAIQAADTELGRLLDHIDYDDADTVIIVTADNGTPQDIAEATQALWEDGRCKNSVGECGLWVPMIVSGAGVGNGTADILVSATDLHATILDIAGVENEAAGFSTGSFLPSMGGRRLNYRSVSFWANLQDHTLASRRSCIYAEEFNDRTGVRTDWNQAIRDSTHKLMRHNDDGADPAEECFLVSSIREAVGDRITLPDASCTALGVKMDAMNVAGGDPCR